MIEIQNLSKVYRQKERQIIALSGVNLKVDTGTIHGIIGRSGAGKSTLVRCLTLLEAPTDGSMKVHGQEMSDLSGANLLKARRRIGMVFQHANLFDARTAAQNVAYPLEIAGVAKNEIRERVRELLKLVGLEQYEDAYPRQLSGGQKQRVGIARALATDPDVLLCDEPTSALDPQTTYEVLDLIKSLRQRLNLTVLIITHEMHVVKYACDSVSLLENGIITEGGPLGVVVQQGGSKLSKALLPLPAELPAGIDRGPVLDLLYTGDGAAAPVISGLSRQFNMDINVLAGTVEELAGSQFAHLRIQLPEAIDMSSIQQYLSEHGVSVVTFDADTSQNTLGKDVEL